VLLPAAAIAAAMELQGDVAVQPVEAVPFGETKSPVGSGPMQDVALHRRNPLLHANPH
jgi:hypothetical protein